MRLLGRRGHQYRARIRLGFFEGMASNDTVASGRDRWAFGTWPGDDTEVDLPDQIVAVDDLGIP